jgi:two-component sensor histidine kinase
MKKCRLLILLLLLGNIAFAQTSNLDELPLPVLRNKLRLSGNDTNKVNIQLALGHLMLCKATVGEKDIDSAINFSAQAGALSRQLNYQFGIINSMLLRTETLYHRQQKEAGLEIAKNALSFAQRHFNSDGEARSYHLIAQYYSTSDSVSLRNKISNYNKAIGIFRKNRNYLWLSFLLTQNADLLCQAERPSEGLKLLFEALNLGKSVSRRTIEGIYWNIGRISMDIGDYTNSLKYDLFALQTAKEVKDTTMQFAYINHLIASTYIKIEDYAHAIPYSNMVLNMAKRYNSGYFINAASSALALEYTHTNKLSKALAIFNEMKKRAVTDNEKLSVDVDFLHNLLFANKIAEAGRYAEEIKELLPKIPPGNVTEIMNGYNALASYYSETNQVKKAYYYTELYTDKAHKLNYSEGVEMAENLYTKLFNLNRSSKSDIGHFLKDKEIRDSANHKVKAYQVFLLDMENEALKKNRHIDSLTMDARLKDSKLKQNQLIQNVFIGGAVMLLIITGLIYSRYRLKQRSNALLTLQKEEIYIKNNVLQQLISDKNELLKDKDELLSEKELLLKEVNHRVKNNLQSVMLLLDNQASTLKGEAFEAVNVSRHRIYAMSLVHEKLIESSKLKSISMGQYLLPLIEHIKDSFQGDTKIYVRMKVEDVTLDVSVALPLALIVNEAATNAFKYAFPDRKSGEISISLNICDDQICLEIADNGIGMNVPSNNNEVSGMGLKLIRGLCSDIDGLLTIENSAGTRILVLCKSYMHQDEVDLETALPNLPDLNRS